MKIAIDISQTVYGTGVGRYTQELVQNLLNIDKQNEYILFGASLRQFLKLKKIKNELVNSNKNLTFKLIPLPLFLLEFIWNKFHFLPIETFVGKIDLLHTSDWLEPPTTKDTKKVTTVHDMLAYLFPQSSHQRIVRNQRAKLERVKKETHIIIADSKTTKEDLVKFLQVPSDKIKVVYLAASSQFKPQDEDVIEKVLQKYKIKKPYILSVSTQEPRKNIQKLIDVFENISKLRSDITLVLTGKKAWTTYEQVSTDKENIIFTGYIPEDDLICLYSGCRVFVYPSLYEGFGLPILEAMACGVPTITSNNSSMAEIAKDAAILIDPRSDSQLTKAIEMVLDLKLEDYQKMVNASLNRARQYSWAKTAKQTLQIYKDLVKLAEINPTISKDEKTQKANKKEEDQNNEQKNNKQKTTDHKKHQIKELSL